jgi:hypothetical protein
MQDPSAVALKTRLDTRDPKQELRDFIQQDTSARTPTSPLKMRGGSKQELRDYLKPELRDFRHSYLRFINLISIYFHNGLLLLTYYTCTRVV